MLSQEPSAAAQWQVVGVEQLSFHDLLHKFPRDTVWSILEAHPGPRVRLTTPVCHPGTRT